MQPSLSLVYLWVGSYEPVRDSQEWSLADVLPQVTCFSLGLCCHSAGWAKMVAHGDEARTTQPSELLSWSCLCSAVAR